MLSGYTYRQLKQAFTRGILQRFSLMSQFVVQYVYSLHSIQTQLEQSESETNMLTQQLEEAQAKLSDQLSRHTRTEEELQQQLHQTARDSVSLQHNAVRHWLAISGCICDLSIISLHVLCILRLHRSCTGYTMHIYILGSLLRPLFRSVSTLFSRRTSLYGQH